MYDNVLFFKAKEQENPLMWPSAPEVPSPSVQFNVSIPIEKVEKILRKALAALIRKVAQTEVPAVQTRLYEIAEVFEDQHGIS